ncbi:MAG: endonuclease/exonuclease/phosphatase family protein [Pedobacter sp.]|uniref:endonuclease/exonuclease/phosphatase family protein n=1 Tax=Pedobacter sp. TaxID=1411316 RepID=UPI0035635860
MKSFNYRYFICAVLTFFSLTSSAQNSTEKVQVNKSIKVMSYNIRIASPPSKGWGFTDLQAVANAINRMKPDLVALQEVDVYTERSGKHSNQGKELAEKTGMYYHFAKAVDRSGGDYGVAVLSRFPIIKGESFRLPLTKDSKGEIRAAALIRVKIFGEETVFMSAHLDHLSDIDRKLQVEELNKIIKNNSKYPLIFGADLNMRRNNPVINILEKEVVFNCVDCESTFPADKPTETIDYLMLNKKAFKKFKVSNYRVGDETYASDHLPLMMDITKK